AERLAGRLPGRQARRPGTTVSPPPGWIGPAGAADPGRPGLPDDPPLLSDLPERWAGRLPLELFLTELGATTAPGEGLRSWDGPDLAAHGTAPGGILLRGHHLEHRQGQGHDW